MWVLVFAGGGVSVPYAFVPRNKVVVVPLARLFAEDGVVHGFGFKQVRSFGHQKHESLGSGVKNAQQYFCKWR